MSFFSWLDFLDSLVGSSESPVAEALCEVFRERLLQERLEPALVEAAEAAEREESGGEEEETATAEGAAAAPNRYCINSPSVA